MKNYWRRQGSDIQASMSNHNLTVDDSISQETVSNKININTDK